MKWVSNMDVTKHARRSQLLGVELNLVSLVFSAMAKVLNKFSLISLSPVFGALMTSVFAGAFVVLLMQLQHKQARVLRDPWVIALGVTNGIGVIMQFVALSLISPVTVTLIAQIYLIYVFILAYLCLHEHLGRWDYLAIACCLAGRQLPIEARHELRAWGGVRLCLPADVCR